MPTFRSRSTSSQPMSASSPSGRTESQQISPEGVREQVKNLFGDLRTRASDLAHNAGDSAGHYYDEAGFWLRENRGKTIAVVGALAAVGLLGFYFGRRNSKSDKGSQISYEG